MGKSQSQLVRASPSRQVKAEGERGVLFVGGIGLARGYLEEEQKTEQKFLQLPGLGRAARRRLIRRMP